MSRLLAISLIGGAIFLALLKNAAADILYPCACGEYYVQTCTPCPQGNLCEEEFCKRTTTWQNASCSNQNNPGTCILLTDQPGYSNKEEWWYCQTAQDGVTCNCPQATEATYTWTTPVNVTVINPGSTNCPVLKCSKNQPCAPN